MKYTEIEFKYSANNITRKNFDIFMSEFTPFKKELLILPPFEGGKDSVDHYFSNGKRFFRWRNSTETNGTETWELTSKTRTSKVNNNIRNEVNLPLVTEGMSFDKAKAFSEMHKLFYDFSIKKSAKVIWVENVVISHYATYTLKNNKLDTWLELEADESVEWSSEAEAMETVLEWEKKFAVLGITPQHRVKRSLFEMYTTF